MNKILILNRWKLLKWKFYSEKKKESLRKLADSEYYAPKDDKGVSKFLKSETGKKRLKEIMDFPVN